MYLQVLTVQRIWGHRVPPGVVLVPHHMDVAVFGQALELLHTTPINKAEVLQNWKEGRVCKSGHKSSQQNWL